MEKHKQPDRKKSISGVITKTEAKEGDLTEKSKKGYQAENR